MAEETMPAIETNEQDMQDAYHYEFAFHLLPTIADEEVTGAVETFKKLIVSHGGEVTAEEAPQRFDLAYRIRKMVDGGYQNFASSFFGWVRFTVTPDMIAKLTEEIQHERLVLRFIIVRLSRADVERPFRVFEKPKRSGIVGEVGEGVEVPAEDVVVLEKELDASLDEITSK